MTAASSLLRAGVGFVEPRSHRCLFQNECLQAHLLGLKAGCPCLDGRFPAGATLIVTFGEASARVQGRRSRLHAGDRLELPPACPFHLDTESEADIMLLLPTPASSPEAAPAQ